ncbi:hypothetical protein [Acidocella sp.]|uniref:hypothetical protein n=1 Tax=Acidocella sp. TaxID=50710 RepID=UPI002606CFAD|nr:hypothetical protein [Acidocella sp.]
MATAIALQFDDISGWPSRREHGFLATLQRNKAERGVRRVGRVKLRGLTACSGLAWHAGWAGALGN